MGLNVDSQTSTENRLISLGMPCYHSVWFLRCKYSSLLGKDSGTVRPRGELSDGDGTVELCNCPSGRMQQDNITDYRSNIVDKKKATVPPTCYMLYIINFILKAQEIPLLFV